MGSRPFSFSIPSCFVVELNEYPRLRGRIAMSGHQGRRPELRGGQIVLRRRFAPPWYELLLRFYGTLAGFGDAGLPLRQGEANTPWVHVAFRADTRWEVGVFYGAVLGAGAGTTAILLGCGHTTTSTTNWSSFWTHTVTRSKRSSISWRDRRSTNGSHQTPCILKLRQNPAFYSSVPGMLDQDVTTAATLSVFR